MPVRERCLSPCCQDSMRTVQESRVMNRDHTGRILTQARMTFACRSSRTEPRPRELLQHCGLNGPPTPNSWCSAAPAYTSVDVPTGAVPWEYGFLGKRILRDRVIASMTKPGTQKSRSGPIGELRADAQQKLMDEKSLPRLICTGNGCLAINRTSKTFVNALEL